MSLNNFYKGPMKIAKDAFEQKLPDFIWDPDDKRTINAHGLLTGKSGSGKTTFLKELVKYLHIKGKHIYVFDLKGDMVFKDNEGNKIGNYIEFTAWDSDQGISAFDTGVTMKRLKDIINDPQSISKDELFKLKNSGPKVQVQRLTEIVKKNYFPTQGHKQTAYQERAFLDTYRMKDFVYNDIRTWVNPLPSFDDTLNLVDKIKEYVLGDTKIKDSFIRDYSYYCGILIYEKKSVKKYIEQLESNEEFTNEDKDKINDTISQIKYVIKELNSKDEFEIDEETEFENIIEVIDELIVKNDINFKNIMSNKINKNFLTRNQLAKWFSSKNIDIEFYNSKEAMRKLDDLKFLIAKLKDTEIFKNERLDVKPGLNVLKISGLEVDTQRVIVDIFLGQIFKACKIRGEYSERLDKSRGEKCDTFFIIDESKLIAGSSRDKNDSYSYLNRIASESRSVGLALFVAAQSASHYPAEFLKNFEFQMILDTGPADFDNVKSAFNLNKDELGFTQNYFGNALLKKGRVFEKVTVNCLTNLAKKF